MTGYVARATCASDTRPHSSSTSRVVPTPTSPTTSTTLALSSRTARRHWDSRKAVSSSWSTSGDRLAGRAGIDGVDQAHRLAHLDGLSPTLDHDRPVARCRPPGLRSAGGQGPRRALRPARPPSPGGRRRSCVADHGDGPLGTDGGHQVFAGVDADGEGQVTADVAHGERRGHRPLGIVAVGHGYAEDRHQRVTHVLVDGASMVGDDLGQPVEGGIDGAGHRRGRSSRPGW